MNTETCRFLMLGGFLGAGKTTAIGRLARHYTGNGKRVAVVTNDQAYDLVDTMSLRRQGLTVGEVPGACFCCKFDDLIETVAGLAAEHWPEVVLAEPVGSCTDLVATVIEPLRRFYDDRFEVGPFAVLLKPEHGRKILGGGPAGFSPQAAYIFRKQLEEADVICVNKIDKLTAAALQELTEVLERDFPGKAILRISAREGQGFEQLISALAHTGPDHREFIDLDYDRYAEGEAELGWLNCQAQFESRTDASFSLDQLLLRLAHRLQEGLAARRAEAAHVKILAEGGESSALVNLVGAGTAAELSVASRADCPRADLVVNARVATAPDALVDAVREALSELADDYALRWSMSGVQSFQPGRPQPTHRMKRGPTG